MLRDQLKGTGVALVTPFKEDKSIDFDALEKLINFVIDRGVQYLVTLGTTGETPTLSREEKIDLIQATFSFNAGRVPVVVGIGGKFASVESRAKRQSQPAELCFLKKECSTRLCGCIGNQDDRTT